jgi:hypothetical protein
MTRLSTQGTSPGPGGAGADKGAPKVPAHGDRPDEETVKRLAQQAKQADQMWNLLVPERNIDYRGVVGLIVLILALHTYNSYNRAERVVDSLPHGAKKQLQNGSYLMHDGSIQQIEHTATLVKAPGSIEDSPMILDKIAARLKPS